MLYLRTKNTVSDWSLASQYWDCKGVIYGIYHFTTRRWYVGQTINTVHLRAQGHWWARAREPDLFHETLALDTSPFSFVPIPLELIPDEA